jgi:hypothetical protein
MGKVGHDPQRMSAMCADVGVGTQVRRPIL